MSKTSFFSIACVLALGCAESIPPELTDARQAYARAKEGPAAQYYPAGLHTAKTALNKAEATYETQGNTFKARDRAYIAARKAKIAETQALAIKSEQRSAALRNQIRQLEQSALARMGNQDQQMQRMQQDLEAERSRRAEAERRMEQARSQLASIAQVQESERGTVITIPGSVLFTSGQSELRAPARRALGQVAQALATSVPNATMEVEGHTDAVGSEQFNQKLSEKRAESVREFLISHGVSAERITAKGMGESRPIGDNSSPEGRALNRRVEIVVQPTSDQGSTGAGTSGTTQGQDTQGQETMGNQGKGTMGNQGQGQGIQLGGQGQGTMGNQGKDTGNMDRKRKTQPSNESGTGSAPTR